jgi:hypothetical protein
VRPEDLARLHLAEPVDPGEVKADWLAALDSADAFARRRPPDEVGCLYYAAGLGRFVDPDEPGGVLQRILESSGG